jgi:16S rRNA pseudouridine516 synthase
MPRLDVLLARNLGASRTAVARLIESGRVQDEGGHLLGDRRQELDPAALPLTVLVDGEPRLLVDVCHLMLNKPVGVVTALCDARHPTAYQLLREAPLHAELRPVGRLDLDSSGLLLWTTDGQWVQRLTHPKRKISRSYQAALARPFRLPTGPLALEDGHVPEITALGVLGREEAHPSLVVPAETHSLAHIRIVGGAYHEVRRIFAALGSHVLGLCRVAFGRLELPRDLPPGSHQSIDPAEI